MLLSIVIEVLKRSKFTVDSKDNDLKITKLMSSKVCVSKRL